MLFAYLSDSDNVTPVYEMYPIGWFSIRQRLADCGFDAKIVSVASLMLMYPDLDVRQLLSRLESPIFGFDLHWMTQCHGAIELAAVLKQEHPDALTVFGGISATYYASQLISYPSVDLVVQGYDTLDPVTELVDRVRRDSRDFRSIPNLLYKADGEVQATSFTHKPTARYNNARNDLIVGEPHTMKEAAEHTSIYALQCYSENKTRMHQYLGSVQELGYCSAPFEQFNLAPQDTPRKMGDSTDAYIMLSPESHDPKISAAAGRDTYNTMAEMEDWIPRALDAGVKGIMVWFFIGMPYQDRQSVPDTVSYSERLIRKFATIDETRRMLGEMERARVADGKLPATLRDKMRAHNRKILTYSSDQIIPVRRPFGGRWFDDATVPQQMIEDCRTSRPGPASLAAA
jgi:clorobiocin/coumermycin A biosynthesis protein CloN6/CouN6